jgi:hypothetical protein
MKWKEQDIAFLCKFYPTHGKKFCSEKLGFRESVIRIKASTLGLRQDRTSSFFKEWQERARVSKIGKKRPDQAIVMKELHKQGKMIQGEESRKRQAESWKKTIAKNGHPKGMLGKHHSKETCELFSKQRTGRKLNISEENRQKQSDKASKMMQERLKNHGSVYSRSNASWYLIDGKKYFFRSSWEVNYARYLTWLCSKGEILSWEYEPDTFWFEEIRRGVRSYLPDFKVFNNDGTHEYHEVKGYLDKKSKTKLKRMKKYYPKIKLVLIDKVVYKSIITYERLFGEAQDLGKIKTTK